MDCFTIFGRMYFSLSSDARITDAPGSSLCRWIASKTHFVVHTPQPIHLFDPPQKLHRTDNGSLCFYLFFRQTVRQVAEGRCLCFFICFRRNLAFGCIVTFHGNIVFIQLHKITTVSSYGQGTVFMYITMKEIAPSRPAAIASMANLGPVYTSPPTKISGSEV